MQSTNSGEKIGLNFPERRNKVNLVITFFEYNGKKTFPFRFKLTKANDHYYDIILIYYLTGI